MDGNLILQRIRENSREPFKEVLARMIGAEPDEKAIRRFARQYPDRWSNMISVFSKLAGFREGVELEGNLLLNISNLSDAEIDHQLSKLGANVAAGIGTPGRSDADPPVRKASKKRLKKKR